LNSELAQFRAYLFADVLPLMTRPFALADESDGRFDA
jgi:hypothetical protein